MAFEDKDLEFLVNCVDDELDGLFYLLTHDRDGNLLNNVMKLTKSDSYKKHFPKHSLYVEDIAQEIAHYGSNSKLSKSSYKDLLCLVCNKLNVNYNSKSSIKNIETNFLMRAFSQILEKLSYEDIENLDNALIELKLKDETPLIDSFESLFFTSNVQSYLMKVIVANSFIKALIKKDIINNSNEILDKIKLILQAPANSVILNEWSKLYYKDEHGKILNDPFKVTQLSSIFYLAYLRQSVKTKSLQNLQDEAILIDIK